MICPGVRVTVGVTAAVGVELGAGVDVRVEGVAGCSRIGRRSSSRLWRRCRQAEGVELIRREVNSAARKDACVP